MGSPPSRGTPLYVYDLLLRPLGAVTHHHYYPQTGIVGGYRAGGRAVCFVDRHTVTPYRRSAWHPRGTSGIGGSGSLGVTTPPCPCSMLHHIILPPSDLFSLYIIFWGICQVFFDLIKAYTSAQGRISSICYVLCDGVKTSYKCAVPQRQVVSLPHHARVTIDRKGLGLNWKRLDKSQEM